MRKSIGVMVLALVVGLGSLATAAPPAKAAGGSWFDTHVFQRGCRAHQPDCAHNWVP